METHCWDTLFRPLLLSPWPCNQQRYASTAKGRKLELPIRQGEPVLTGGAWYSTHLPPLFCVGGHPLVELLLGHRHATIDAQRKGSRPHAATRRRWTATYPAVWLPSLHFCIEEQGQVIIGVYLDFFNQYPL